MCCLLPTYSALFKLYQMHRQLIATRFSLKCQIKMEGQPHKFITLRMLSVKLMVVAALVENTTNS